MKTYKRGDNVLISCNSITSTAWSFNDGKVPQNVVLNSNQLYIGNAQVFNSGYYDCEGTTEDRDAFFSRANIKIVGE